MSKKTNRDLIRTLADEMDILNDMLTALAEVLQKKGLLSQEEWETKIKSKIKERTKTKSYRDIQF